MKPPLRKAQRISGQETSKKKGNSVRLEPEAARLLKEQAKKLRLTEIRFVSAAVTYFAEAGLDPTVERPQRLQDLGTHLREEARTNRALTEGITSFLKQYEKSIYSYLRDQQISTNNYLQQIENTLLQHQVAVETNLIRPMVEHVCEGILEANATRKLVTRLFTEGLQSINLDAKPAEPYEKQNTQMDNERDRLLTKRMRAFYQTNRVPKPVQTPQPWFLLAPPPTSFVAPNTPMPFEDAPK
jgi:hypothetical protein